MVSLPSERFTRFGNPAWPGGRTANFAAFGAWPWVLPKNAESLRDSDALMRVAVPRRRGPAGLRFFNNLPSFQNTTCRLSINQSACHSLIFSSCRRSNQSQSLIQIRNQVISVLNTDGQAHLAVIFGTICTIS